ncbi:MAG: methylated-DNA--[protein]-cysteine S-methyltransferase [Bacillota bacterium]|nr:methylated-DNA--[protein]-cysteine S-methyltransferase [Bacillota bacterium]
MNYVSHYESPIGGMTMTSDGESLTGLMFDGETYFEEVLGSEAVQDGRETELLPVFQQTIKWLDTYFQGSVPDFTPKLVITGSPFRKRVCQIMLTIPYGHTMSYGQIAEIIAAERGIKKMAAQAVGGAVGHNPISLIIPCHRVVGSDGSLTGYGGGIEKKSALLELERSGSLG